MSRSIACRLALAAWLTLAGGHVASQPETAPSRDDEPLTASPLATQCDLAIDAYRSRPFEAGRHIEEIVTRATAEGTSAGDIEALLRTAATLLDMGWLQATADLAAVASELAVAQDVDPLLAARALTLAAAVLSERGSSHEAQETARRALAIAETHGPHSEAMAAALEVLGQLAINDDPAAAIERHARALAIREALAPNSPAVADSLRELGTMIFAQGKLVEARKQIERARAIDEQDPESLDAAWTLHGLGLLARKEGDSSAAVAFHRRGVEIQERQAPESIRLAQGLNWLGLASRESGDAVSSHRLHLRALGILKRVDPDSMMISFTLMRLAETATTHAAAADFERQALDFLEARVYGSQRHVATLVNVALRAHERGDFATERDYNLQALELEERRAPNSPTMGGVLGNMASFALIRGDIEAAELYQKRSYEIRSAHDPESIVTALALSGLGDIARARGDLAAAQVHYERSFAIRSKIAPDDVLGIGWSLIEQGELASERGDLTGARQLLSRALEVRERAGPGSYLVAEVLTPLGDVARRQGEIGASRDYQQRALRTWDRLVPDSFAVALALRSLGGLERDAGNLDLARNQLDRAWEILRRQMTTAIGDSARQASAARHVPVSTELAALEVALGRPAEAFATVEEGRARALLESMAVRGMGAALDDPRLWDAYEAAAAEFERAAKLLASATAELERREHDLPPGPERSADLAQAAVVQATAHESYTASRVLMEQRLAEVKRAVPGLDVEPVALDQARAELPPGTVFLAFAAAEHETLVFLLRPSAEDPVQAHVLALGEDALERLVASFRERIDAGAGTRAFGHVAGEPRIATAVDEIARAGHELFETLVPAAARQALASATRVIVSPDAALWELPFAALVTEKTPEGPRWLGLDKRLSYAPSLTVLAQRRSHPKEEGVAATALVVGDPQFSPLAESPPPGGDGAETVAVDEPSIVPSVRGERGLFYRSGEAPIQLPATRAEALGIARLYGTQPLLGPAATEAAVRAGLTHASVAHLATHGYFHPQLGMSSGVLLAAPPGEPVPGQTRDDGVLQAWEFGPQLLLRADLVVLSACETGRGQRVRGEGVVGLTRALLGAGAQSVVATQWRVADQASSDLMVEFHRRLRKGLDRDDALRVAMRETAQRTETRHPFYWAPYFLSGATDPLEWSDPAAGTPSR